MIAANYSTVRARFKDYLDQVAQGETVIVTRKNQQNALIINVDEFKRQLEKERRNATYDAMIDHALADVAAGRVTEVEIDFSDIEGEEEELGDAFFIH
ncbi:MAG: type II toxin-antitoxin system Phd/YefM family antitoxin [Oscillospiraceae bacterium]|nr:type II toxin-antitoxin system Phd/YefM family antitoxin [Oscillospiraceae bacterium]